MVWAWHRLPRLATDAPFLEAFKVGWGPGKSKLVKAALPMARGVGTSWRCKTVLVLFCTCLILIVLKAYFSPMFPVLGLCLEIYLYSKDLCQQERTSVLETNNSTISVLQLPL